MHETLDTASPWQTLIRSAEPKSGVKSAREPARSSLPLPIRCSPARQSNQSRLTTWSERPASQRELSMSTSTVSRRSLRRWRRNSSRVSMNYYRQALPQRACASCCVRVPLVHRQGSQRFSMGQSRRENGGGSPERRRDRSAPPVRKPATVLERIAGRQGVRGAEPGDRRRDHASALAHLWARAGCDLSIVRRPSARSCVRSASMRDRRRRSLRACRPLQMTRCPVSQDHCNHNARLPQAARPNSDLPRPQATSSAVCSPIERSSPSSQLSRPAR